MIAVHAAETGLEPLGTGFVIDDRRILTCAHVALAVDRLWVGFAGIDGIHRLPVDRVVEPDLEYAIGSLEDMEHPQDPERERWQRDELALKDLAVLYVSGPMPAGVTPAPLRFPEPDSLPGKPWRAFGFPTGDGLGLGSYAEGRVGDPLLHGWIRLNTESRDPLAQGFSGGGLWSPDDRAMIAVIGQALDGQAAVGQEARMGDGRAITLHAVDRCFPSENLTALDSGREDDSGSSAEDAGNTGPSAGDAELVSATWNWSLRGDSEGREHWGPRARGVSLGDLRGHRFRGRVKALEAIRRRLDGDIGDPAGWRVLVVTGEPGAGKSAVLGRIVTTADREAAGELPASDNSVRATIGSVSCAVHAKGKTALEVAAEITRAASAPPLQDVRHFARDLRNTLEERGRQRGFRPFNVIIDALDEAASPQEAHSIVEHVIRRIPEVCAGAGARVIVGSRPSYGQWSLEEDLEGAADPVDLGKAEYFDREDLVEYALVTLRLAGDERPGNPYADEAVARPVAEKIAELSGENFLVAGLTAWSHGLTDSRPVDPAALSFSPKVDAAMKKYIEDIPPVRLFLSMQATMPAATPVTRQGPAAGRPSNPWEETPDEFPGPSVIKMISAEALLTPLAFAEAPGLTIDLWRTALRALGNHDVPAEDLAQFARSAATSFLVESSASAGGRKVFRLFHQALNETLRVSRVRNSDVAEAEATEGDERALARAFLAVGQDARWDRVPDYLLRALPGHARRGNVSDELLADDRYLLVADLRRVLRAAGRERSLAGRDRIRLLSLTRDAFDAGPHDRTAMFGVREVMTGLGAAYQSGQRTGRWAAGPYRARWAVAAPSHESSTLRAHGTEVLTVCAVPSGDQVLLAAGCADGTVRLWDVADGGARVLPEVAGAVCAVCTVSAGDQVLLAAGCADGTVRLWEPGSGEPRGALTGHKGKVQAICAVPSGDPDRTLLATGGADRTVRVWDLADDTDEAESHVLTGHHGAVFAVCPVPARAGTGHEDGSEGGAGGGMLLASGGSDRTVRLWNPIRGAHVRDLEGHQGGVFALGTIQDVIRDEGWDSAEKGTRVLLASGGGDRTVRLWDPDSGEEIRCLEGHHGGVRAVCALPFDGRILLAAANGGIVRVWDLAADAEPNVLRGHHKEVRAVHAVAAGDRMLLATGGDDQTARLWDLRTAARDEGAYVSPGQPGPQDRPAGVFAVCVLRADGEDLLATGTGDGTVGLWDAVGGIQIDVLAGPSGGARGGVRALCALPPTDPGERPLLAVGGTDGTIRLWDPSDLDGDRSFRARDPAFASHSGDIRALCAAQDGNRTLLAAGGNDGTVRLWDPGTSTADGPVRSLGGHPGGVRALCTLPFPDPGGATGQPLLAVGSADGAVRLWEIARRSRPRILGGSQAGQAGRQSGRRSAALTLCPVRAGNRILLAVGGTDGTVRLWDPVSETPVRTLTGHRDAVRSICAVRAGGRTLLATGGDDLTVRLWNPASDRCVLAIPVHHAVLALAPMDGSLVIGLEAGVLVIDLEEPGSGHQS